MEAVLCLVALSTLLYIWFLKLTAGGRSNSPRKPQLPPGPWTLPIIGSLHHVISTLPHRTITELCRRHGPLMLLKLGELPAVVISSAEAVAQVMKTNDAAFLNRRTTGLQDIVGFGGQGIIFAPYGDHWRQMRKICVMELLSPRQVRRMEGIRAEQVGGLVRSIASLAGAATINVSQEVAALSNGIVTRAVFGGNFVRQEEYLRQVDEIMDLMGGFCLVDLFPSSWLVRWLSNGERRMNRSCASILGFIADIIDKRKAMRGSGGRNDGASSNNDEDLLDVLLRLQHEDSLAFPLTTEMIATVLFDMFGAATETTGTTLEWAMSELITHPEAMAKAQFEVRKVIDQDQATISNSDLAELPYLRMVIKEVLRLHPPTPLLPRKTREDCKIMGFDILKETNIYINIFAISRDPQYWDNPTNFNPERFENNNVDYNGSCFEFTPFGGGRRQCPGITFASSILEITLANFLYHFDWMLPDEASLLSLDMSEKFGFSVRRRSDLQLRAIPRTYSKTTPI